MSNNSIYKIVVKYLWVKLTKKMWKLGFGRFWMKSIVDDLITSNEN